jgi:hypothetical protein
MFFNLNLNKESVCSIWSFPFCSLDEGIHLIHFLRKSSSQKGQAEVVL